MTRVCKRYVQRPFAINTQGNGRKGKLRVDLEELRPQRGSRGPEGASLNLFTTKANVVTATPAKCRDGHILLLQKEVQVKQRHTVLPLDRGTSTPLIYVIILISCICAGLVHTAFSDKVWSATSARRSLASWLSLIRYASKYLCDLDFYKQQSSHSVVS